MRSLLAVFALSLLPAVAQAQPPAPPAMAPVPPQPPPPPGPDLGKWWKSSEVVAALGLPAPQIQKIEQAFLEHRLKLIDLRADLEREETRLQPLIDADQPDEAQVGAAIDRVTAARGRLEKANAMMMLAIRRILTVEQWHKLEALKRQRERRFILASPPPPPPPGGAPERAPLSHDAGDVFIHAPFAPPVPPPVR
jgi:periplasmic protein CpxP/Spy